MGGQKELGFSYALLKKTKKGISLLGANGVRAADKAELLNSNFVSSLSRRNRCSTIKRNFSVKMVK